MLYSLAKDKNCAVVFWGRLSQEKLRRSKGASSIKHGLVTSRPRHGKQIHNIILESELFHTLRRGWKVNSHLKSQLSTQISTLKSQHPTHTQLSARLSHLPTLNSQPSTLWALRGKGPQGPKGPVGPKGPQGPKAQLSTLDPNSQPSTLNS